MDVDAFLDEIRAKPDYAGQIVHVHTTPARPGRYADPRDPLEAQAAAAVAGMGIERLYVHQAAAVDRVRAGRDVVVVTGTASGKSLCYLIPILEMLESTPGGRALLLFPTKALCQDQCKAFARALAAAGREDVLIGVYDGDTPSPLRRKLRDRAAVIFSNPDMVHAAIMPQHARWAQFLADLRVLVLDELHTYSGIFGANMANLLRRLARVCEHYGSAPRIVSCSATIANPRELAERLTGREPALIDDDAAPRGARTYVFWNPPRIRGRTWRSRRSANVEAHELMAELIARGQATITFSKAKMTAEMIYRYVCEKLAVTAPHLARKVAPYRGGYLPEERRRIERDLFAGELLGVSATRALELGIDVGGLDACILVGYPGTLASFLQQSGRAGRRERDALVILIGLDTSVNQYVMSSPGYLFERAVERAVIDEDNPFVISGHLRCATHELPLDEPDVGRFGPNAAMALDVLQDNHKVRRVDRAWYHAASETPQHEVSLRDYADANVLIEDADTGAVLGQVNKFDSQPILHPGAIYMHRGDTYRVLQLDLEKNIATVRREEVDYYTQPLGGTDVHHVDLRLREKPFGTGTMYWGEVTAYFNTGQYEKIHFYSLDAISIHDVDLPTFVLETMAVWIVPPEPLMDEVRRAGLDAHSGLRGIGYATRMLLPLFMTCDTLDFSHSIGSANSAWNAIFIYERYPLGLGFTEKAFEHMGAILPAVLATIRNCPCDDGCPCCVGKPLRQYATWNVERGEASIPSKASARMILESLLAGELVAPEAGTLSDSEPGRRLRMEQALRRRLERMREAEVFHPIAPKVPTAYPDPEPAETLETPDVTRRAGRRRDFHRELRKRIAERIDTGDLPPSAGRTPRPPGMKTSHSNAPPTAFPGRPTPAAEPPPDVGDTTPAADTIEPGDSLAARARKRKKKQEDTPPPPEGEE